MKTEKQPLHIEPGCYEGYLWLSDEDTPILIPTKREGYNLEKDGLDLPSDQNPFVIEGLLFDASNSKSIKIKYIDGGYLVKEYSLEPQTPSDVQDVTYQSHRMGGRKLKFLQYWEENNDESCDDPQDERGMKTLRPGKLVFVGFDNN